jgi:hypothetical protein
MPSMSYRLSWPNQSETLSGRLLQVAHAGRLAIPFGLGGDDRVGSVQIVEAGGRRT